MKMKKVLPIVLAVLSVILVATLILTTMFSKQDDTVICKGISINGMDVGGMTPEEATEVVEAYAEELQNRELTIQIDDQTVVTTLGDLGYSCNVTVAVEEAFGLGKEGNFLNRYREQSALEADGAEIELEVNLDEEVLKQFIETECTKFDVEAVNADLTR